jgi:hypothetical protein
LKKKNIKNKDKIRNEKKGGKAGGTGEGAKKIERCNRKVRDLQRYIGKS